MHLRAIRYVLRLANAALIVSAGLALTPAAHAAGLKMAPKSGADETVDLASTSGKALKLKVDSRCHQGKVVFRMKNLGATWPGMATMQVVDAHSGAVVTGRAMRLAEQQSAGFAILPKTPGEALTLRVQAKWLTQPYERAVAQTCR